MAEHQDIQNQLLNSYNYALEHTSSALEYMAEYGIKPEGKFGLFFPPSTRQKEINKMPYVHSSKQVVVYETEQGEFSALCPFSGLPDFGTLQIEYVPGSFILELKSLKYYILSWRNIGCAQEDITAYIFEDILKVLVDSNYLQITTTYNIRGGIKTICCIDSRKQNN